MYLRFELVLSGQLFSHVSVWTRIFQYLGRYVNPVTFQFVFGI